jgi:hypothetical protein
MHIFKWLKVIIFCSLLIGCGKEKESLVGFDSGVWKEDRFGCLKHRKSLSESLIIQKTTLLGRNEMEIVDVLGKPDENELSKRNQKFFYYYLEPARSCQTHDSLAQRLVVRFNAVGLAKEILIE